ncbi:PAN domain-containing protein [Bradyrhizobium sp. STM 3557]|uniref:PAN domain-containing protein n=1 Tax=Bradyrhizobium sp. STM 3557 TaxID=578920 RepID=UPI00388D2401
MGRKLSRIKIRRSLSACLSVLACLAAVGVVQPAAAQSNFDRPGGDYTSVPVSSADPADCALLCEHDRRCRAWSFNYPTVFDSEAVCWLKGTVPPRVPDNCCVSGVRGAGVVEIRNGTVETAIDRPGGDYRSFEIKADGKGAEKSAERGIERGADKGGEKSIDRSGDRAPDNKAIDKGIDKGADKASERSTDAEEICKAACAGDNKCRAWTFARPGYAGKEAHCFLKKEIKPPRRRAGFTSGVLR